MLPSGFYNMDCMDGMREFPDKFFELAIVDPPYGIGLANMTMGTGNGLRTSNPKNRKWVKKEWDKTAPNEEYFNELKRVSENQIIFGGNYFNLPPCRGFIIWDKAEGMYGRDFSECEFAWSSIDGVARIFKHTPVDKTRIHPTQKPVSLYMWILKNYAHRGDKILDTHVGSASSLIACHRMGFEYWGFELDAEYHKAASERLAREMAMQPLFDPVDIYKQESLTFD